MRIVHLTPGTGTFHCGSCLRDNVLIKALRVRKHDAMMVPLYLPLVTDGTAASPEQAFRWAASPFSSPRNCPGSRECRALCIVA